MSGDQRGAVATFVDITAFRDLKHLQSIIDALPEHVAVLEPDGTIAMINRAWKQFAKANGDAELTRTGIGSNYLHACSGNGQSADPEANAAFRGIKAVLEGSEDSFTLQYPCHSPTEQRWFVLNASALRGDELGAVVSHFNVSAWYYGNNTPDIEPHVEG